MQIIKKIRVDQAGAGGYAEYRIPGIVVTPRGTLLICREARQTVGSDWGLIDILVSRSEDEGGRWEQTLKIQCGRIENGQRTCNNPVLIVDEDRVHLIYHENYGEAFICHSRDDGKTWTNAECITPAFREFPYAFNVCATGPGHGLRLKSGRLLAPVWLANGAVREDGSRKHQPSVAGAIYSDDQGQTWHAGALTEGICNANETCIAETANGKVLFNFRNENADRRRVVGLSKDGKEAFSQVHSVMELADPMCFGSMATMENVVVFINCPNEEKRAHLTLSISEDGGNTWRQEQEIDAMGGYADLYAYHRKLYAFFERYEYAHKRVEELMLAVIETD